MIDNKLSAYISIISNGAIVPIDNYIGGPDEKLIYKFIASFTDPNRDRMSTKFIKKLINKIRILNKDAYNKTDKHRYEVHQYKTGDLYVLEFMQGKLKDRYADGK